MVGVKQLDTNGEHTGNHVSLDGGASDHKPFIMSGIDLEWLEDASLPPSTRVGANDVGPGVEPRQLRVQASEGGRYAHRIDQASHPTSPGLITHSSLIGVSQASMKLHE